MYSRQHFDEALDALNQEVLTMGTLVEEALRNAVKALVDKDIDLADRVIQGDTDIDRQQLDIEDTCTVLIAKEQPVASDLRQLVATLNVLGDLERIGDQAVHIAEVMKRLYGEPYMKPLIDIPRMAVIAEGMIHDALTAFVEQDPEAARSVAGRDDQLDALHAQVLRELLTYMMEDPAKISQGINFLFLSRWLERTGDHVTNICERTVFLATGKHVTF
ncbi:MAG: phosphate signaling complex protein PhoU [Spirochaetales bacterium]|nr:phosphate signaling complex protein PhoU [Spirochaetales bacterium]